MSCDIFITASVLQSRNQIVLFGLDLQSDAGSGSDQSDSSSTPLNKSSTPTQTSPAVEITQEKTSESPSRKSSLSRKESKHDKRKGSMKEKNSAGTPEKSAKSKSPNKPQAVVEPLGKTGATEDSSENKQGATTESIDNEGNLMVRSGLILITRAQDLLNVSIIECDYCNWGHFINNENPSHFAEQNT